MWGGLSSSFASAFADRLNMRNPVLIVACLAGLVVGCHSSSDGGSSPSVGLTPSALGPSETTHYVSATIERLRNAQGRAATDQMALTDSGDLATLESYFPQLNSGERGRTVGAWTPAVIIHFKPALGRTIRVMTNDQVWTEGTGDWPISSDFKYYIDRLFARRMAG